MTKETKEKIKECVKAYEDIFVYEFNQFKVGIREKRNQLRDQKFGETKGMDFVDRVLYEVPVTLYEIFIRRLSPDDMKQLKSKKGARWFAKAFPEYRIVEKI